jgi:hypothetical protein
MLCCLRQRYVLFLRGVLCLTDESGSAGRCCDGGGATSQGGYRPRRRAHDK